MGASAARRSRFAFALLAAFALVHVGLVVSVVRARGALDHDEVVSHLVASGHSDDWHRARTGGRPTGTWSSGADLRHFVEIDSHSSLAATRNNLTDSDIHPPLYFWSLLGARSAGLGLLWSGPIINLVAVLLAGAILFSLLVELLDDLLLTALAIGAFALSPALVRSVAYARPYPFLMLAAVGLIWTTARLLQEPPTLRRQMLFFAVGLFGLLTETVFAFAFAGAVLAITARWSRRDARAAASACVAATGSVVVALAIFPAFGTQLSRLNDRAASFPPESVATRVSAWVRGLFDFVSVDTRADRFLELVALVAGLALLATLPMWRRIVRKTIREQPIVTAALAIGATAFAGATAAYVLHRSPPHATGWQYVIVLWPAIVLLTAAMARNLPHRYGVVALVVVVAILFSSAWSSQRGYEAGFAGQRRAVDEASSATVVVADCLADVFTLVAAIWVPRDARFLLTARGDAPPPPIPPGADRSRPILLHGVGCRPAVRDVDRLLATLGYARGRQPVGRIGMIAVFPLTPSAG